MKKETIIWQIIALVLGVSFIAVLSSYLSQSNWIKARTNMANCYIESNKEEVRAFKDSIQGYCFTIK